MKKCTNYFWVIVSVFLTLSLYPILQVEAGETEILTSRYFLTTPGKTLIYQYQYSIETTEQVMSVWEQDETGIYTNTVVFDDGSCNFAKYVLDNSDVAQIDSGFSVPRSEWSNDPVIFGKNIVFKNVAAGSTWTNDYQTIDGWDTICRYRSKYTFVGFENIVVMDEEVQAARFNCLEEKTIVAEPPMDPEWGHIPYTVNKDEWYVNGVGLVKSKSIMENPITNEQYTITSDLTDIAGVAITPNIAVNMVCQQLKIANQKNIYACQNSSEDGLYVVLVEVPYGYPKSDLCGQYYVSPWTGAISKDKNELLYHHHIKPAN